MVSDCCMLHPELAASISVMTHVHGLWDKDVSFEEVVGCQLLKSVLVPSSLLGFIKVHPLLIWVILTVIPLIQHIAVVVVMTHNARVI